MWEKKRGKAQHFCEDIRQRTKRAGVGIEDPPSELDVHRRKTGRLEH